MGHEIPGRGINRLSVREPAADEVPAAMKQGARRANVAKLLRLAGVADDDSAVRDEIARALLRRSDEAVQTSVLQLQGLRSVGQACSAATQAKVLKADADAWLLVRAVEDRIASGECPSVRAACRKLSDTSKRADLAREGEDRWAFAWESLERAYYAARQRVRGLEAQRNRDPSLRNRALTEQPCEQSGEAAMQ